MQTGRGRDLRTRSGGGKSEKSRTGRLPFERSLLSSGRAGDGGCPKRVPNAQVGSLVGAIAPERVPAPARGLAESGGRNLHHRATSGLRLGRLAIGGRKGPSPARFVSPGARRSPPICVERSRHPRRRGRRSFLRAGRSGRASLDCNDGACSSARGRSRGKRFGRRFGGQGERREDQRRRLPRGARRCREQVA